MRRLGVVLLGAVMMAGSLIVGGGALVAAQGATPVALPDHPLVGAWLLDSDSEDPANPPSLDLFWSDGTVIDVAVDGSGVGVWEATGANTANVTIRYVDPEGMAIIRANVEVAPDGQRFTAAYTLELVGPDGTSSGEIGPSTAEGTRLAVEPQGAPVGTFEEIFGAPPAATPEG